MRPLRLTMTAFGPFGGTEIVDFREATDAGLFGIYGPTGSGKSSIFSAMAFALFGEGARGDQPIASMRSDHAAPDVLTEVSLLFELGARRYLVRRQPDQSRPKQRGEGETAQPHQAWLFDVTDVAVEQVSDTNCGTVLAEKRVSEVARHLEALLGYDIRQFRQIVLLPQGQFERFLAADSRARLEILRGLFDVSLYRAMTERMKERAAAARQEVQDGLRLQAQRLANEGFASTDELGAAIEAAEADAATKGEALALAEQGLLKAEAALAGGEALARRFEEAEGAAHALQLLEDRTEAMDALRARSQAAERARQLVDLDETVERAIGIHAAAVTRAEAAATALTGASAASARAQAALSERKADAAGTATLQREADDLERFEKLLAEAADLRGEAEAADQRLVQAKSDDEDAGQAAETLSAALERQTALVERVRRTEMERVQLNAERSSISNALLQARQYDTARRDAELAEEQFTAAEAAAIVARGERVEAEETLARCRQDFIAGQARLLAAQLEAGAPCPVCGSADHPEPAHGGEAPEGLEEAMREAESAHNEKAAAERDAESALSAASGRREERQKRLETMPVPEQSATDLEARVTEMDGAIAGLGMEQDLERSTERRDQLKQELERAAQGQHVAAAALAVAVTAAAVAQRSYADQIAAVPDQHRDPAALGQSLIAVRGTIQARHRALEEAQEAASAADAEQVRIQADLVNANTRVEECQSDIHRADSAFEARRAALNLAMGAYAAAKAEVGQIEAMHAELSNFQESLARVKGRLAEAKAAIEGRVQPDLPGLRASVDDARAVSTTANRAAAAAIERHGMMTRLRISLADDAARLAAKETETGPLRALAEAFDGQNLLRTTLETYAVGAMFDQVLEAANLRLDPMTAGRYRLERDNEAMGGRSRRGLDIRVHDIQTGRAREVSTLSGGETFIAALSLALGLSDIVEMCQGSIRLDTIFIDEGFGTLDSDGESGTLDLVLQVLQDIVGQRRAVGLISHVPLVQQAVPNGFTVVKGIGGSRIEPRTDWAA